MIVASLDMVLLMASRTSFMSAFTRLFPIDVRAVFFAIFFFLPIELKSFSESMGITDTDTKRLSITAQLTAMAMSLKSCPASSCTKTTGRKTATVVSVDASTAPHTSRAPS